MKDTREQGICPSYEDIVEGLSEGVIAVDLSLNVCVLNQSAEKICEVSRNLVIGRHVREVFKRDERPVEMLDDTLKRGKLFAEYEEKLKRRFGGELPVGITTSQIFDAHGALSGAVAVIKDLSGIKSLEAGSLRRDRLAFIGEFAANLAHEIKNPLSGIRGAAQLLSKRIGDAALSDYTDIIIREADRLNNVLKEMLDFARPSRLVKKDLNIHKVLDGVILIMQEGLEPDALRRDYDPSLPPVYGDEGQLTQVFLNLVKNAKEAISKDGHIQIVSRMTTDFHLIGDSGEGGKMALIEIKDDGPGINAEDMDRIFTPFFTTKAKGSGLGLPISLKIIKEHGGLLNIGPSPGGGTTAVVHLPVAVKEAK